MKKKYRDIPLSEVEYISIDEFSIRKRHKYMTVISDLKTGKAIHAVEERRKEDIEPFLRKLKKSPHLKAVCMDLSKSYTAAVKGILPEVDIVFDRFHVMALVNKALDQVRKTQYKKLSKESRRLLKGQRFLLLKNGSSAKIVLVTSMGKFLMEWQKEPITKLKH